MAAEAAYDAILGPAERVDGRPFADPAATERDASVLRAMLLREREMARSWARGRSGAFSLREHDGAAQKQWLSVPDTAALLRARDATVVGFFGQSRHEVDHGILFELEEGVANSFTEYAKVGLLSYYDLELGDGSYGYGNLILFSTPDVPPEWYDNPAHERAVAISSQHYESIRLHKGRIEGPLLGDGDLSIERTKYFDFRSEPAWKGLRVFADLTV